MNPTDHPAGTRLITRGESATGLHMPVETTVLEWSLALAAKIRYNLTNHIEWLTPGQAAALHVIEVLAPAPTHPPHPFDETVDAAWRMRAECRYVSKTGTYEDGTRMLMVVGVGPAAESLARIIDAASSIDPRSTTEKPMLHAQLLKAPPTPYPKT